MNTENYQDGYKNLSIQPDEMECLLDIVGGEFNEDAFVVLHVSMMLIPKMKEIGIFRQLALTHPEFRISTREIAIALRMAMLNRNGLMMDTVLHQHGVFQDRDINKILLAMYQIRNRDSCCLLSKWDIEEFDHTRAFTTERGLLCEDVFDEVELCELVMSMILSNQIASMERLDLDIIKKDSQKSPKKLSMELAEELGVDHLPIKESPLLRMNGIMGDLLRRYLDEEEEEEDEDGILE